MTRNLTTAAFKFLSVFSVQTSGVTENDQLQDCYAFITQNADTFEDAHVGRFFLLTTSCMYCMYLTYS